jgi:hypothetical protein
MKLSRRKALAAPAELPLGAGLLRPAVTQERRELRVPLAFKPSSMNLHCHSAATQAYDQGRAASLAQAGEIAINGVDTIPVIYVTNTWAMRVGLDMRPRTDEYTRAASVRAA